MKKISALIFSALFAAGALFAQVTTDDAGLRVPEDRIRTGNEGFASEEFRRGVQAYYKGAFNEAIVQFEKALAYLPDDNLILDWLGKAYYKAGLEGSALSYWTNASENGYGGLLLENKIEIVRARRCASATSSQALQLLMPSGFFLSSPTAQYAKPAHRKRMYRRRYTKQTRRQWYMRAASRSLSRRQYPPNTYDGDLYFYSIAKARSAKTISDFRQNKHSSGVSKSYEKTERN